MRGISMVEFNDVELGVIREILFGHADVPKAVDIGALVHRFNVAGHPFFSAAGANARYAFVQKLQGTPPAPALAPAPTSATAAAAAQVVVQEIREYCEYMFSPQWLADPQNRSIFAAHVYDIIRDGAAAAPDDAQGVAVAPAPLSFKCAGYDWHFRMTDEVARLRAENAALTEKARDAIAEADIAETAHKQACDVIAPLEKALSVKEAELVTLRADNTRISGEMEQTSATLGALSNSYGKLKAENTKATSVLSMYSRAWRREIGDPFPAKMYEIDALVAVTKERIKELNEWRSNARADETGHLKNCSTIDGTWRCAARCAVFRATTAEAEAGKMKKARDTLYVERNEIEKQWKGQAVELRDALALLCKAHLHVNYNAGLPYKIGLSARELLPQIDQFLAIDRHVFYTDITNVEAVPAEDPSPKPPMPKPLVPIAPGTIFKHYKTGNTYRKLFKTTATRTFEQHFGRWILHDVTITTDGVDDQKVAFIGTLMNGDVFADRETGVHIEYDGVVYIALDGDSAGRIFFRAKAEFEALVLPSTPHPMTPRNPVPRFQDVTVKP